MAFNVGEIIATLSLKKKISVTVFRRFLFSIYRVKIGDTQGSRLLLLACPWGYKAWWK